MNSILNFFFSLVIWMDNWTNNEEFGIIFSSLPHICAQSKMVGTEVMCRKPYFPNWKILRQLYSSQWEGRNKSLKKKSVPREWKQLISKWLLPWSLSIVSWLNARTVTLVSAFSLKLWYYLSQYWPGRFMTGHLNPGRLSLMMLVNDKSSEP